MEIRKVHVYRRTVPNAGNLKSSVRGAITSLDIDMYVGIWREIDYSLDIFSV